MTESHNVARYRANLQGEVDGAALYHALADAEPQPQLAQVYRRLADVEERHAAGWEARLRAAGASVPQGRPGWRTRAPARWRWANGCRCRAPASCMRARSRRKRPSSRRCLRKKKRSWP